jgi:hypothetical protein
MLCLNRMIKVAFLWFYYNKKKNAVNTEKGAKGKGIAGLLKKKGLSRNGPCNLICI